MMDDSRFFAYLLMTRCYRPLFTTVPSMHAAGLTRPILPASSRFLHGSKLALLAYEFRASSAIFCAPWEPSYGLLGREEKRNDKV